MKISKTQLKRLALTLHFEMDEDQLERLHQTSESLITSLELLNFKDVDELEPMVTPNQKTCNVLREDVPIKENNPDTFLHNAKNKKGRYVVVK